jgi:hypothetical protein
MNRLTCVLSIISTSRGLPIAETPYVCVVFLRVLQVMMMMIMSPFGQLGLWAPSLRA